MTDVTTPLPVSRRAELQAVERRLADRADAGAGARALLHRDAVYLALDLGDVGGAMAHALACLDLARTHGDVPLEVKAHVALALVQADSYDDLGASTRFALADTLARAAGDSRGVALVAINASHYELERRQYGAALSLLVALRDSTHMASLDAPESAHLLGIFHVNFVVSASEALLARDVLPADVATVEAQLAASAEFLRDRERQDSAVDESGVLDALTRHALWADDLDAARQLADEHVQLTRDADLPLLYGRALLDRSRVHAATTDLEAAVVDAQLAVRYFGEAGSGLWEARSRAVLAAAYARAGRYREAYDAQRAVTVGVENLYRDYHQQRALVGQIEQQARDAEVRAAALAEAALRDPLTGAPNRARAMQVLAERHARAAHGRPSAVALLDLDLFKRVNDTYGHLVGDTVLIEATRLLSAELREDDLLARLGGEEFVVVLADVDLAEAAAVCGRLRASLQRAAWETLAPGLVMTASFGVAMLDGVRDVTATLRAADRALYAAKAAGRNAVHLALPDGPA